MQQKSLRTATNLTSTLLKHYVASQLESILDRGTQVSHEIFATRVEARIGSGEGPTAKGPDMKVWGKGKGLENVRIAPSSIIDSLLNLPTGRLAIGRIRISRHRHFAIQQERL